MNKLSSAELCFLKLWNCIWSARDDINGNHAKTDIFSGLSLSLSLSLSLNVWPLTNGKALSPWPCVNSVQFDVVLFHFKSVSFLIHFYYKSKVLIVTELLYFFTFRQDEQIYRQFFGNFRVSQCWTVGRFTLHKIFLTNMNSYQILPAFRNWSIVNQI